jgi:hypothetical protein
VISRLGRGLWNSRGISVIRFKNQEIMYCIVLIQNKTKDHTWSYMNRIKTINWNRFSFKTKYIKQFATDIQQFLSDMFPMYSAGRIILFFTYNIHALSTQLTINYP